MSHDLLRLHRIHGIVGLPAYAKTAGEQSESEPCPPSAYGDLEALKYPCQTKEAAFNSCLLAHEDGVSAEVQAKLATLAEFWGITADVTTAYSKLAAVTAKTASAELSDADYALVQEHAGQPIRKFAAYDRGSVVTAAEAFYGHRHQYPFAWRKEASARLLAAAERYIAVLPDYVDTYLRKAAGYARPTTDSVDEGLVQRLNLSHRSDEEVMDKVATLLCKVASAPEGFDDAAMADVLTMVDAVDRECKLARHYEHGRLALPEEMLVIPEVKTASAQVRLVNGRMVEPASLSKEALAAVDEDLATMSLAKLAEVLPTLPRPEADLLVRLGLTKVAFGAMNIPQGGLELSAPKPAAPAAAPAATPGNFTGKGPTASAINTFNDSNVGTPSGFGAAGNSPEAAEFEKGHQTLNPLSPVTPSAPQAPGAPPVAPAAPQTASKAPNVPGVPPASIAAPAASQAPAVGMQSATADPRMAKMSSLPLSGLPVVSKFAADMGALTDDNFSDQTSASAMAPAPAAPTTPAMPAAPAAPAPSLAMPMSNAPVPSTTIATGDQARAMASNVGHNQAMPVGPEQRQMDAQRNDANVASNGLGTSHAPLR